MMTDFLTASQHKRNMNEKDTKYDTMPRQVGPLTGAATWIPVVLSVTCLRVATVLYLWKSLPGAPKRWEC